MCKALSELTGITYESLKNKMSGTTEFKRSEMIQIEKEFPECSLDYLFATEDERGVRENGPNEEDNIKPRLFTDQP